MDCIVIGAGASGLFAARKLASSNYQVKILEARGRIGGRIYTNRPEGFSQQIEGGAEFLHGEVPLTQQLCKEAGVLYHSLEGNMYRIDKGELCRDDFFDNEWKMLLEELGTLKDDKPLEDVINQKFSSPDYNDFKAGIRRFVEGYSAADVSKVSSHALRNEWADDDDPTQYRPEGGYGQLMDFLERQIKADKGEVILNAAVQSIRWEKQRVIVVTADGTQHQASKVLITVPLGVLQKNAITFTPEPAGLRHAVANIGFGAVVKIVIEFTDAFWQDQRFRSFSNPDFLFTDAPIPTWWTQSSGSNVLTGWLGGPDLETERLDDEAYMKRSLESLAYCFACPQHTIRDMIVAWKVFQWLHDPFARGAYTYAKIGTPEAVNVLGAGFESTLYFAGEAIYGGSHTGTVEAALESGRDAAGRMMSA